jgi:hypothetical protein
MFGSPQGVRQFSLGGGRKPERRAHTSCRGALFWVATKALAMTELPAIPPARLAGFCNPWPESRWLGAKRRFGEGSAHLGAASRLPAFFAILALARLATNSPEDGAPPFNQLTLDIYGHPFRAQNDGRELAQARLPAHRLGCHQRPWRNATAPDLYVAISIADLLIS